MSFADLAAKHDSLASSAHARAVDAAADAAHAALTSALGAHVRTGNALSELSVTAGPGGVQVDEVRYQRFIKGVPRGEELGDIARAAYNASIMAQVGGA